jgi:hypothetical protein
MYIAMVVTIVSFLHVACDSSRSTGESHGAMALDGGPVDASDADLPSLASPRVAMDPGTFLMGSKEGSWRRGALDEDEVRVTLTHRFLRIPETPDHPFLEVPIGKVVCGLGAGGSPSTIQSVGNSMHIFDGRRSQ